MTQPPSNARAQVLSLLDTILSQGRTLDEALASALLKGSEADVKFGLMLLHTSLRHLGQLDALIASYLEKPLPVKRRIVTNALRLGVVQLLLLDTPAHAAVNETVALVKKGKDSALAGLVNAVLQKISRERPALPDATANLPAWLRERWQAWYGAERLQTMAGIAATRPPLDLNMQGEMQGGTRLDAQILRLPAGHQPVDALPGYAEGQFFVQDIAASYPARLLGDVAGKRVLDLCAAPGGKAMQLTRSGAHVTALDRSRTRLRMLRENQVRLGCSIEIIEADLLRWQPTGFYDAVLLDAPCSATGTWRRHPEVVRNISLEAIHELAMLQREMLARAWQWVTPGGRMVYCVCSLEREEGEAQAEWFLEQFTDAKLASLSDTDIFADAITHQGYLRTLPSYLAEQGGMDGFFAVAFEKH